MSRFETSNSAYGSYLRSGNSNYKPNRNTMMSIEKPKLDIQQNHQKLPAMDIHQHKTQILGDGRPRGLINLRNTCYINSILQILFEILEVPANSPISASYMALRNSHSKEDYWEFKDRVEAKLDIVQGHYQQDAQEFLRGLLELLNQENKVAGSSTLAKKKAEFQVNPKYSVNDNWRLFCKQMERVDNSLIVNMFAGQTYVEMKCEVGHTKYRFQRFLDLNLPFSSKDNTYSLNSMLRSYFTDEIIDGVQCEKCRKKAQARRSICMYNLPNILVLHLNRFYQGMYANTKIKANVSFDEVFEIPKDILHTDSTRTKYQLIGSVNHVGSLNAGHYYAVKRGIQKGKWYMCNDEIIRETGIIPQGNVSEYAYILFYKKL